MGMKEGIFLRWALIIVCKCWIPKFYVNYQKKKNEEQGEEQKEKKVRKKEKRKEREKEKKRKEKKKDPLVKLPGRCSHAKLTNNRYNRYNRYNRIPGSGETNQFIYETARWLEIHHSKISTF